MISKLHQELKRKKISAQELVRDYYAIIEEKDNQINAFLSLNKKLAEQGAREVDEIIARGHDFPLIAGLPVAIKDNILTKGQQATAASKILENYVAPYNATVVDKLNESGMVMLGKTNLDEFAMGGSTENSAFKITKNPLDVTKVPGGSSGGSAAAVATGMAVYALGTDTGGSVRQPASFCGLVGLKPTYGSCSRFGLVAMGSSLDQPGPITSSVEDAQIVFNLIKGKDPQDATTYFASEEKFSLEKNSTKPLSGLKIGLPKEYFINELSPIVKKTIQEKIKYAEKLGAQVIEISLSHTDYALAVYYIIMPAEVSSNLSRYDGIRYTKSLQEEVENLYQVYAKTRGQYLGDEVKRRIMLGNYVLSAGYYDAYYKKAQQVRTLIRQDFEKAFQEVDLLITPTAPSSAFEIGNKINDPIQMYLEDIFTVPASVAGVPAMSMPAGHDKNDMPLGMQLIASWKREDIIFEVGKIMEKAGS